MSSASISILHGQGAFSIRKTGLLPALVLLYFGIGIDLSLGNGEIFMLGQRGAHRKKVVGDRRNNGQELAGPRQVIPAVPLAEEFPGPFLQHRIDKSLLA